MKKNILQLTMIAGLGAAIAACSTAYTPTVANSGGFLPEYSINLMKPVPTDQDDVHAFVYKNPNFHRSDYDKLIVEEASLNQQAVESKGITTDKIANAQAVITKDLKEMLAKKVTITNKPGPRTAKLSVAITGAMLEGDGFRPRYLMPISAALQIAQHATNLQNKKPILIIETKVVDSKTNELLTTSATEISGEKFRLESSESGEFTKIAKTWVQDAIKYAFKNPENNN